MQVDDPAGEHPGTEPGDSHRTRAADRGWCPVGGHREPNPPAAAIHRADWAQGDGSDDLTVFEGARVDREGGQSMSVGIRLIGEQDEIDAVLDVLTEAGGCRLSAAHLHHNTRTGRVRAYARIHLQNNPAGPADEPDS